MPSLESRNDMLRCDRQWRNKFIVNGTWTMFHNVLNMHAIMGIGTRIKFLQSIQTSAYITMHHCLCLLVGRSINWQILKGQNVNNATLGAIQNQIAFQWNPHVILVLGIK